MFQMNWRNLVGIKVQSSIDFWLFGPLKVWRLQWNFWKQVLIGTEKMQKGSRWECLHYEKGN